MSTLALSTALAGWKAGLLGIHGVKDPAHPAQTSSICLLIVPNRVLLGTAESGEIKQTNSGWDLMAPRMYI